MKLLKFGIIAAAVACFALAAEAKDPECISCSIEPGAEYYNKAKTGTAVFYNSFRGLTGTVCVKTAKYNKRKGVKITVTVEPFYGKKCSATVYAKPDSYGELYGIPIKFKAPFGYSWLYIKPSLDGSPLEVEVCFETGLWANPSTDELKLPTGQYEFCATNEDIPDFPAGWEYLASMEYAELEAFPDDKQGYFNGSKFDFGKAPSLKFKKDKSKQYYMVPINWTATPNANDIKLKYNKKKGWITGSYKIHTVTSNYYDDRSKPIKIKSYKASVNGVWDDGYSCFQTQVKMYGKTLWCWAVMYKIGGEG